jgi:DNA-binding transcriptional LysR family regulator
MGVTLPRQGDKPLPLLMYSRSVYFARLVDLIIETAGGIGKHTRIIETDMSDILRDMAMAGHGIAWLPESTVKRAPPGVGRSVLRSPGITLVYPPKNLQAWRPLSVKLSGVQPVSLFCGPARTWSLRPLRNFPP